MLATRLWMGTILVVLTVGMLVIDPYWGPVYPFLFVFQTGLALLGCVELILLLGPGRRPQLIVSLLGVLALTLTNWLGHWWEAALHVPVWTSILACFTGLVLVAFLVEMEFFVEPERCLERLGLTLLILAYLGILPSFFAQLRWLAPEQPAVASVAMALAIFVPKCGDIGAYFVGRALGRHPMTPLLSPKKTWEGMVGGLAGAVLATVAIDRLGPVDVLQHNLALEIGFGLALAVAGMLGDLAESLIKRDCRKKDASMIVPGFGGVLDVIDAIIFAAPVSYLGLSSLIGWQGPIP